MFSLDDFQMSGRLYPVNETPTQKCSTSDLAAAFAYACSEYIEYIDTTTEHVGEGLALGADTSDRHWLNMAEYAMRELTDREWFAIRLAYNETMAAGEVCGDYRQVVWS